MRSTICCNPARRVSDGLRSALRLIELRIELGLEPRREPLPQLRLEVTQRLADEGDEADDLFIGFAQADGLAPDRADGRGNARKVHGRSFCGGSLGGTAIFPWSEWPPFLSPPHVP